MKRLITILILTSILFLSGCTHPATVSVVQDAYGAALVENDALVESYFSEDYLADHPIEKLSDEMGQAVRKRKGIDLMNIKELKEGQLTPQVVKILNEEFAGGWNLVAVQTSDDTIMVWVVYRGEQKYSIVNGKQMDTDIYFKDILK